MGMAERNHRWLREAIKAACIIFYPNFSDNKYEGRRPWSHQQTALPHPMSSATPLPPLPNFNNTLGVALVCTIIVAMWETTPLHIHVRWLTYNTCSFYGVTNVQTYLYYTRYRTDKTYMKILVSINLYFRLSWRDSFDFALDCHLMVGRACSLYPNR